VASLRAPLPLSVEKLNAYFRSGAKPRAAFRVGVEQEKIAVYDDGRPVPYEGGIEALLGVLEGRGFSATREDGHVIALGRGADRITVEPGGQVELSGGALPTAAGSRALLAAHVRELQEAARPLGIRFLGIGARPFGAIDDVDWLPKRRYAVMRRYYTNPRFPLAHHMMKMTATVQANFDYENEADALDKLRTAYGITSIVTAMFAASPFAQGRPTGLRSFRAAVWLETDPDRAGLLPFVFSPGASFRDYVEWALDVPMYFVVRDGVYHPAGGATFRRFLMEGFRGTPAIMRDWEVHLSTLFPEVRLKRYVEVRGADAGPMPMAAALGALWRGILDDPSARAAAWALVADRTMDEREALRRAVPGAGLTATFGGRPLSELARELVEISDAGLARIKHGQEDRPLLEPLRAYAAAGRSPADDLLDDYQAAGGDPAKLVARWELRA
jgi:glutamate--cysteine ligase